MDATAGFSFVILYDPGNPWPSVASGLAQIVLANYAEPASIPDSPLRVDSDEERGHIQL